MTFKKTYNLRMENLFENEKLFSFEGFLSKRNFLYNFLFITILLTVIAMTFVLYSMQNGFADFKSGIYEYFLSADIISIFLFLLLVFVDSILTPFNIIKRLNDIKGKKINNIILPLFISYIAISRFIALFSYKISFILLFILLIFQICLFFIKGKLSKPLPDDLEKFNFGAFFGTWLWGIKNRVYYSIFFIPLFFTPCNILFALILGLKGNEWAKRNNPEIEINEFHNIQKNEAKFWAIFALLFYIISGVLIWVLN